MQQQVIHATAKEKLTSAKLWEKQRVISATARERETLTSATLRKRKSNSERERVVTTVWDEMARAKVREKIITSETVKERER